MMQPMPLKDQVWRHTRTMQLYVIVGVATHTETLQPIVVYRRLKHEHDDSLYARPLEVFLSMIESPITSIGEGKKLVPRFEYEEGREDF